MAFADGEDGRGNGVGEDVWLTPRKQQHWHILDLQ
jgi:hypothetical protein